MNHKCRSHHVPCDMGSPTTCSRSTWGPPLPAQEAHGSPTTCSRSTWGPLPPAEGAHGIPWAQLSSLKRKVVYVQDERCRQLSTVCGALPMAFMAIAPRQAAGLSCPRMFQHPGTHSFPSREQELYRQLWVTRLFLGLAFPGLSVPFFQN